MKHTSNYRYWSVNRTCDVIGNEETRLISGEKLCVKELKSIRDQLNSMIEKEEWEEKNPITGASVGGGKPTQGIHF